MANIMKLGGPRFASGEPVEYANYACRLVGDVWVLIGLNINKRLDYWIEVQAPATWLILPCSWGERTKRSAIALSLKLKGGFLKLNGSKFVKR